MRVINNNELREEYEMPNDLQCPKCKGIMNHAIKTNGIQRPPECGDIAICVGCAEILIYNADKSGNLFLNTLNNNDIEALKANGIYDHVIEMQNYVINTNHGLTVKK